MLLPGNAEMILKWKLLHSKLNEVFFALFLDVILAINEWWIQNMVLWRLNWICFIKLDLKGRYKILDFSVRESSASLRALYRTQYLVWNQVQSLEISFHVVASFFENIKKVIFYAILLVIYFLTMKHFIYFLFRLC